jgi:hypothetical protein
MSSLAELAAVCAIEGDARPHRRAAVATSDHAAEAADCSRDLEVFMGFPVRPERL